MTEATEAGIARLRTELLRFDPTLAEALERSRRKVLYQLGKIGDKVSREALRRSERVDAGTARLVGLLYPQRHLQERFYSILPLLAQHGLDLIETIYRNIDLDSRDHRVLTIEPMGELTSQREAQQRADRIRAFRAELAELEREGAVTLDPAQSSALEIHLQRTLTALAERFDIDATESQRQISWGMRIASTLGGLALCAAVVLFFYRFWGVLGIPAQVGVLVVTPLLMLAATEFAARRERTPYYASLFSLVAFGAFVLNLNVLGSIFNLTPSRNGLLAWGVFALLPAYAYRLRLPLAAGLACLMGYLAASFSSWWGGQWQFFFEKPENFLLGGLILDCRPRLPLPPPVHRIRLAVPHLGTAGVVPRHPDPVGSRCVQLSAVAHIRDRRGVSGGGLLRGRPRGMAGNPSPPRACREPRGGVLHPASLPALLPLVVGLDARLLVLPDHRPDLYRTAGPLPEVAYAGV